MTTKKTKDAATLTRVQQIHGAGTVDAIQGGCVDPTRRLGMFRPAPGLVWPGESFCSFLF